MELKNDISIRGTLKSVDQYLNIKLDDIMVLEDIKYPHLVGQAQPFTFGLDGCNKWVLGKRQDSYKDTGRTWAHAAGNARFGDGIDG